MLDQGNGPAHCITCWLIAEVERLKAERSSLKSPVSKQAEDDGLWFDTDDIATAYQASLSPVERCSIAALDDAKQKAIKAADYELASQIRDLIQKHNPRCSGCGQVKPKCRTTGASDD